MKLTILGNNSALPAYGRHPTAQALQVEDQVLLIDCGEGTQIQLDRYGIRWRKLTHIFISHLHGDHYFGLPGILTTMSLLGRTTPLHLHAPKELETILNAIMKVADTHLSYELQFHPFVENTATIIIDTPLLEVMSFPVEHRITCHGFVFKQKSKGRKLLPEKCREHEVPTYFFDRLKAGEHYTHKDGRIIHNEWVTTEGPPAKRYAYCADTLFTTSIIPYIKEVDLLYHESTYLQDNLEEAQARFHTTATQAAHLALEANVGKLLLGHYSSRYKEVEPFQLEAAAIFTNTTASIEGETYDV